MSTAISPAAQPAAHGPTSATTTAAVVASGPQTAASVSHRPMPSSISSSNNSNSRPAGMPMPPTSSGATPSPSPRTSPAQSPSLVIAGAAGRMSSPVPSAVPSPVANGGAAAGTPTGVSATASLRTALAFHRPTVKAHISAVEAVLRKLDERLARGKDDIPAVTGDDRASYPIAKLGEAISARRSRRRLISVAREALGVAPIPRDVDVPPSALARRRRTTPEEAIAATRMRQSVAAKTLLNGHIVRILGSGSCSLQQLRASVKAGLLSSLRVAVPTLPDNGADAIMNSFDVCFGVLQSLSLVVPVPVTTADPQLLANVESAPVLYMLNDRQDAALCTLQSQFDSVDCLRHLVVSLEAAELATDANGHRRAIAPLPAPPPEAPDPPPLLAEYPLPISEDLHRPYPLTSLRAFYSFIQVDRQPPTLPPHASFKRHADPMAQVVSSLNTTIQEFTPSMLAMNVVTTPLPWSTIVDEFQFVTPGGDPNATRRTQTMATRGLVSALSNDTFGSTPMPSPGPSTAPESPAAVESLMNWGAAAASMAAASNASAVLPRSSPDHPGTISFSQGISLTSPTMTVALSPVPRSMSLSLDGGHGGGHGNSLLSPASTSSIVSPQVLVSPQGAHNLWSPHPQASPSTSQNPVASTVSDVLTPSFKEIPRAATSLPPFQLVNTAWDTFTGKPRPVESPTPDSPTISDEILAAFVEKRKRAEAVDSEDEDTDDETYRYMHELSNRTIRQRLQHVQSLVPKPPRHSHKKSRHSTPKNSSSKKGGSTPAPSHTDGDNDDAASATGEP